MNNPPRKALSVFAGNTFEQQIDFINPDGSPIDLTGKTIVFTLSSKRAEPLLTLTETAGGIGGSVVFVMTDEQTSVLPIGEQAYTVTLEDELGRKDLWLWGPFNVRSVYSG